MESYQLLEHRWAEFIGRDPGLVVACSSGTAALHLALEALEVRPFGSEVIVPDFTMVACPRAAVMAGLMPRFVDCRPNLLMDPNLMREVATGVTRAVLLVHVYGRKSGTGGPIGWPQPCPDMYVIEDLAEAHGVNPHPDTDAACYSFYRNKVIGGQEGGVVAFKDPGHAELARRLRSLGFTPRHDFHHHPRGHNYRLANALADLVLKSLDEYSRNLSRRRELEDLYEQNCPAEWRMPKRDVPWVYDVRVSGLGAGKLWEVVQALNGEGIAARCPFWPMHLQPEFVRCKHDGGNEAIRAANEVFYLPLDPTLPGDVARRAFGVITKYLRG